MREEYGQFMQVKADFKPIIFYDINVYCIYVSLVIQAQMLKIFKNSNIYLSNHLIYHRFSNSLNLNFSQIFIFIDKHDYSYFSYQNSIYFSF
jgi:hypothetical protein